jgi:hypothetical protein
MSRKWTEMHGNRETNGPSVGDFSTNHFREFAFISGDLPPFPPADLRQWRFSGMNCYKENENYWPVRSV